MKIIKYFALGLFGIFAAILIAAAMSSKAFNYKQSITINAPVDKVWPHVNSMQAMDTWSPWTEKDPNIKQTFDGEQGQVGSSLSWQSENPEVGNGKQTIMAIDAPNRIDTQLHFLGEYESIAKAYVTLSDKNGQTEATWGFESEMPFPMNAMMFFMSPGDMLGNDFSKGLNKLKAIAEKS